jgi:hypothetical protein
MSDPYFGLEPWQIMFAERHTPRTFDIEWQNDMWGEDGGDDDE